jgi:hypothetical protein
MKRDITPVIEKDIFELTKIPPLGVMSKNTREVKTGGIEVDVRVEIASIVEILPENFFRRVLSEFKIGESFLAKKGMIEIKGTVLDEDYLEIPCARTI